MTHTVADLTIPDSALARDAMDLIRTTAGDMLFNHSSRVFLVFDSGFERGNFVEVTEGSSWSA